MSMVASFSNVIANKFAAKVLNLKLYTIISYKTYKVVNSTLEFNEKDSFKTQLNCRIMIYNNRP